MSEDPSIRDISLETELRMYRTMVLARLLDERCWLLNRGGKAPFVISCQGHEAAQVGYAAALAASDFYLPYYRDLAAVLWIGMTPKEIMLSLFARGADPNSGGRQMPGHFGSRRLHIVTQSSVVMSQMLHATGIAHASKIRGESDVALCTFGEGATAQGDFHEALNWASIFKLPVVFLCENNGYAISVPQRREMSIPGVAMRADAYGIPGVSVDGLDVLAVYRAVSDAAERARRGDGPTLVETRCVRYLPHSSDDDDRSYRDPKEIEEARRHDPIERHRADLTARGLWDDEREKSLRRELKREIDTAMDEAEAAAPAAPEDLARHVFVDEEVGMWR